MCLFVSVYVYGCAQKKPHSAYNMCERTCADILIHLSVCVQQQCVCFLPIRHTMTGHVVKQLAGLFMDQQLWEEILKYQLDAHTHTHAHNNSHFEL